MDPNTSATETVYLNAGISGVLLDDLPDGLACEMLAKELLAVLGEWAEEGTVDVVRDVGRFKVLQQRGSRFKECLALELAALFSHQQVAVGVSPFDVTDAGVCYCGASARRPEEDKEQSVVANAGKRSSIGGVQETRGFPFRECGRCVLVHPGRGHGLDVLCDPPIHKPPFAELLIRSSKDGEHSSDGGRGVPGFQQTALEDADMVASYIQRVDALISHLRNEHGEIPSVGLSAVNARQPIAYPWYEC